MGKRKPDVASTDKAPAAGGSTAGGLIAGSPLATHIGLGVLCFAIGWQACASQGGGSAVTPWAHTADPWALTTQPTMARDGFNWTQLSMSRTGNFPPGGVKKLHVDMIREKGAMWVHHTTFARSIPALVEGLSGEWASKLGRWSLEEFRRQWGHLSVVAAYSPDRRFNYGASDAVWGRVLMSPDRRQVQFSNFMDEVISGRSETGEEFISVQQSPSRDFSEFGLPAFPPYLEELVGPTLQARNLWVATPGKVSVLHYDWQDSILMQISGSKRFTIIDPARMQTAYPCVQRMKQLHRVAPGKYESTVVEREIDNFPLVNVTHPDFERHPLFKDAHVFTVEVHAGDALFLPAYWYHQVDSFAEPGKLNVAVNYWYQGHSLATRLYRTFRENLFINCTFPVTPGQAHICRDSLL